MRARNIKPGFFKNEDLAECSVWARLIFPGLWMLADREGYMEDRPKRIKGELLPFDSVEVGPLLDELERWGLIKRYSADGKRFLWIPGFRKHQHPHIREKAQGFQPHPEDAEYGKAGGQDDADEVNTEAGTVQAPVQHRADTGLAPAKHRSGPAESLLLNPESSLRETHGGGAGLADLASEFGADFQEFLEAYPAQRVAGNEVEAGRAWLSERKAKRLLSPMDMLAALLAWKNSDDWTKEGGRFACTPQKFLSSRKYLSRPASAAPGGDDPDGSKRAARDKARTLAMLAEHDKIPVAGPPPRQPARASP